MAQSATGMEEGGQGPLAIVAPFTAEASKPGGFLENPVIFDALSLIGPPKGTIDEIGKNLPGLMQPLPGEPLEDLAAEGVAEPSGIVQPQSWADGDTDAGPNIASRPGVPIAQPIGEAIARGAGSVPPIATGWPGARKRRLRVVQKD